MPAALTVDWPAVKATAIALNSIKIAAERHGVTYEAARMRASRESWLVGRRPAKAAAEAKAVVQAQLEKVSPGAVTSVTSTADALATTLADENQRTRAGFSRAAVKVAEKAAKMDPEEILERARSLKDVAHVAGQVHGWDAKETDGNVVLINNAILQM
jgi:hypothetical protein